MSLHVHTCGECYCESCGDCLVCFGEDECGAAAGATHSGCELVCPVCGGDRPCDALGCTNEAMP